MIEEKLSLIPGVIGQINKVKPTRKTVMHGPRTRFAKLGPNAGHEATIRMRAIKEELRLTTLQLVGEINAYEREVRAKNYSEKDLNGKPLLLPVNSVLISSYLQGWVMQEAYMEGILQRLEALLAHKKSQPSMIESDHSIRPIMNGWFKSLRIDPKSTSISPFRQLGRLIAPFYKRPVLASIEGTFHLGPIRGSLRIYEIKDSIGVRHKFLLNPNEPILIKDGQAVKVGNVIQYSVLMQTEKQDGQIIATNEPSINHTTFFRWYTNNKMPRSIQTIELVQAAVDEAVKLQKKQK